MKTEIDAEFEDAGFVYTDPGTGVGTRILYAPRYVIEHTEPVENDTILLTGGAGGWRIASIPERKAALAALKVAYPDRCVIDSIGVVAGD